jgi:hypothetical protein
MTRMKFLFKNSRDLKGIRDSEGIRDGNTLTDALEFSLSGTGVWPRQLSRLHGDLWRLASASSCLRGAVTWRLIRGAW